MAIGREGADIEYEGIASAGSGHVSSAYLARPASSSGCGIIVIHDEWGLTDFIRDVCDRLARAGFVALAPDLFHGRAAEDRAGAEQISKELDRETADGELESAVEELFNQHATTGPKVGALGFGLGGSLALYLSSRHRRIGAVVDLCGTRSDLQPDPAEVAAPVFAVFAGAEESASDSDAGAFEASLRGAGLSAHIELKPGVRNGYMNDARVDVHDAVAAADTWDALLAFFRAELA